MATPEINYLRLNDENKNESSVPNSARFRHIELTKTILSNTSSQKRLKNIFYVQPQVEFEEDLEKNKFLLLEDWNELIIKLETLPKF